MSSKIQKRKMTAEMPYDELLSSYTAGDLKEMCKLWGMKGYSKFKKEEMIEALVAQMDANFEDRFLRMNLDHFTVINELAKGNNVFLNYPMAASELTGLGMIIEGLIDGEKQVMMPRKVYDQFGALYGKYHEVLTLNTILKDYMELSVELYGVMKVETFVENFYKFNEEAMDRELIQDAMSYTIMRTKNTVQTGDFLHYYRLGEFEKVYGDIQTKTEITEKLIDHDLLQRFIQNNNTFWNENHVRLEKALVERFHGDHDMMIDTMDELRVMASYNHGVADFIQLFTKKRDDAKMDDIKVFADLIITINNEMPHWELKGHAPAELSQYQKQQPIIKGDKIGRNDSCPCGSGKKYKKCCLNK